MPAFMYDYQEEPKEEKHVRIVCTADPTKVYDILKGAYERAAHISSCDEIVSGGETPPPWWYIVATDLLIGLYKADDLVAEAAHIIKNIQSYIIEDNGKWKSISHNDRRKIVDAMSWIHQKGLISYAKDEDNIDVAIRAIRNMIYRNTR